MAICLVSSIFIQLVHFYLELGRGKEHPSINQKLIKLFYFLGNVFDIASCSNESCAYDEGTYYNVSLMSREAIPYKCQ